MQRGVQGVYRIQNTSPERFRSFAPAPLPPTPALERTQEFDLALSKADQMLGRLDGLSRLLPSVGLLLYFYTRKEAVLSSQIEGTQTTLSEYLLFELDAATTANQEDAQEVSNYVAAMQHGLQRMREGFPLSLRLLREIHAVLLRSGRGRDKDPGEFRRQQNWIGGTRPGNASYVPPAVHEMHEALHALEGFLHGEAARFPVLIQAALLHAQFETIHPFQDGNGRLGRLLITLLLVDRGVLREPLLYLSLYLKQHRDEYFQHLQELRVEGTWEAWIEFFLVAVATTAERAVQLAHDILALTEKDRAIVQQLRNRGSAPLRVFEQLQKTPYTSATQMALLTGLTFPPAKNALEILEQAGIVFEITGKQKGKLYVYRAYVDLMNQGADV